MHQLCRRQEVQPLRGLFTDSVFVGSPLQVSRDCGTQKPEAVHSQHCAVEDSEGGQCRGPSPEVYCHLHGLERVQVQVVLTTSEDQLLHLPSVCRLTTILDQADDSGIIRKLQDSHRRVP